MSGRSWQITPNAIDVPFDNSTNGYIANNVQEALEEGVNLALDTPVFPLPLVWNGTISDGEFYGYSNLIPGDATPLLALKKSELISFTWSNGNAGADFTLVFRKNNIAGTPFLTVSRVNTKFFAYELLTPEAFNLGDQIYIEHQDDGTNSSDVGFVLTFRALP